MENTDLPSDSDSSDEDFVPQGAQESGDDSVCSDDEEEDVEDEEEEDGERTKRKRTKRGGKKIKKKRRKKDLKKTKDEDEDDAESNRNKNMSEEEVKKKADSLWADFMKDVGGSVKTKKVEAQETEKTINSKKEVVRPKAPEKIVETQVYTFAGEEVKITKEAPTPAKNQIMPAPKKGSLSNVLGQLSGKNKLTTLEKSKLDWQQFKANEGIEDELQIHNRGRGGYLERQAFLQRTDLRQFEIEKDMRAVHRGKR